jgi:hypothetical protein
MLFRELLIKELNDKRKDFARFAAAQSDELESYFGLLKELAAKRSAETAHLLGTHDVGAIPSSELDLQKSVKCKFEVYWQNHEAARAWALRKLENRVTFAADGSQLAFEREISLRVAAIQVGTFENRHNRAGEYAKQARFEIVTPQEISEFAEDFEEPFRTATVVGLRRFNAEIRAVEEFLIRQKGWKKRGEPMPLAFFDGTLLVSFSLPTSRIQHEFIHAARNLVLLSKETEVPIVGYVAQSEARDLINLLDNLPSQNLLHQPSKNLTDAQILSFDTLGKWGERTIFFECQRKGLSEYFVDEDGQNLIGFVYLQTTADALPARLDIPVWIYKNNLLEEVLDTVRAEAVTGLGYPYVLETADATAVITARDREIFLRALQEFSATENLNFRVSNKKISKARRR